MCWLLRGSGLLRDVALDCSGRLEWDTWLFFSLRLGNELGLGVGHSISIGIIHDVGELPYWVQRALFCVIFLFFFRRRWRIGRLYNLLYREIN